jgi:hypothetical protein
VREYKISDPQSSDDEIGEELIRNQKDLQNFKGIYFEQE